MAKNDDKLNELLKQAEEGIREVFESDKYREYLNTMAKFHNYSYRNTFLILMQKPEATCVAGYVAWQTKFNRQVKRGEKGIPIVGYNPKTIKVEEERKDSSGNIIYGSDGKPETETVTKIIPCFKIVYVYDVSQTVGEPLPQLVNELDGSVASYNTLMTALSEISPFPINFERIESGAKGYCDFATEHIVINEGMSEVQTVKTAIHEIAHACLHASERNTSFLKEADKHTQEVEAESTAFIVCSHYGIDTSDYSFPYLAAWSSSQELKELHSSLATIQNQAAELIEKIDNRLEELHLEQNREGLQMYRLNASQADRMRFDEITRQYAWDAFNSLRYTDESLELTDELLKDYRKMFLSDLDIDDLAEATARFDDAFRRTWAEELEDLRGNNVVSEKPSMKDRFAAAQAEAKRRESKTMTRDKETIAEEKDRCKFRPVG